MQPVRSAAANTVGVSQRKERSEQHRRQSSWMRFLHIFGACGPGHGRHVMKMAKSAMRGVRAPAMVMILHGDGGRWPTLACEIFRPHVHDLYVRTIVRL